MISLQKVSFSRSHAPCSGFSSKILRYIVARIFKIGFQQGIMNTLPEAPVKYCGRLFTPAELDTIRQIISRCQTRRAISIQLCAALGWVRPDEQSKEMSARVALLRMERDGLLELPAPTHSYTASRKPVFTAASDPEPEFSASCSEISFTLHRVATPERLSKVF
jgi:hypothetical protein